MRDRSDHRRPLPFYRSVLYCGDVVFDLRCGDDLSFAVGDYFHGRRFLVYKIRARRDVCLYCDPGCWLLLRLAQRRAGVGLVIAECQLKIANWHFEPKIVRLCEKMNPEDLKRRTKQFALRILKLVAALPNTVQGRAIGGQLVRAGTAVGANYRAACRGRSKAEFIAKLGTVEEEADESAFWLELIIEGGLLKQRVVESLLAEANELTKIMARSRI